MSDGNKLTRRNVLRTVGAGVGVALLGSTNAAAKTGSDGQDDIKSGWISVQDGHFVLNITPEEMRKSRYQTYREGVDNFNEALESGFLSLKKAKSLSTSAQDSQYILKPNSVLDQPTKATEATATTTASCNRGDVVIKNPDTLVPGEVWVNIYLTNDDIRNIDAIIGGSSTAGSLIYAYLVDAGYIAAGALASPAVVAIGAALAAEWGWIKYANNGCGVKIETGYSPVNPTYQIPTVESQ